MTFRPMQPRWEDEALEAGRAVLVLHHDGTVQRATRAEELEPIETAPFTMAERAAIGRILARFAAPRRVA